MHENGVFGAILEAAIHSLPGCIAIVFIDQEGEAVDAVGWADEFEIKVTGAHLRIMMDLVHFSHGGETTDLLICASQISFRVHTVSEGYILVLLFARDLAFYASQRALDACSYALSVEAGFPTQTIPAWFAVDVDSGESSSKPLRARSKGDWLDLEVLGVLMELPFQENGYRVRLSNGHEVTLIREALGRWWSDAPLQ